MSCPGTGCLPENKEIVSGSTIIPTSSIPLPLPADQLKELVSDAIDFSLLHGAGMRYRNSYKSDTLSLAPFFLLPTPFPRRDFEKVYEMQPLINKLMHKVAHDHEFLEKCLKNTIKVDDFTKKLWDIYTTVRKEGIRQPVTLGLLRCDVILDMPPFNTTICSPSDARLVPNVGKNSSTTLPGNIDPDCECPATGGTTVSCDIRCSVPKQVEVNTIAASFAALSTSVQHIQEYVLNRMGRQDLIKKMPSNPALAELCSGMLAAYDYYNSKGSVIIFVVEDVSYNICDQRFHEYEVMRQRPEVLVLRRSLTQINKRGRLDAEGRLWVDDREVALLYFRAGYDPSCYHGPAEWETRLMIERSLAIKCPTISYHLSGTKKVQQELAAKGALNRFLSPDEAQTVSQLFTGLYSMDMGAEGDESVEMALKDPEKFVLKPQREGGGNNLYGDDIKNTLNEVGKTADREAFILMDRIRAPIQTNYVVRPEKPVEMVSTISELGIFGALLGSEKEVFLNKSCGHMLRSKLSSNNEGGVASGNGALDSVLLVD